MLPRIKNGTWIEKIVRMFIGSRDVQIFLEYGIEQSSSGHELGVQNKIMKLLQNLQDEN